MALIAVGVVIGSVIAKTLYDVGQAATRTANEATYTIQRLDKKSSQAIDEFSRNTSRMAAKFDQTCSWLNTILKLIGLLMCILCAQYIQTMPTATCIFEGIYYMSIVFAIYLGFLIACDLYKLGQWS